MRANQFGQSKIHEKKPLNCSGPNRRLLLLEQLCHLFFKTLLLVFVVLKVTFLFACALPKADDKDPPSFDAALFYAQNTVEINAVGDYGIIKAGTGVIIGGDDFPIIVTSLHVTGTEGALISVKFHGEDEFVNTNTIINDNIIEVLAFSEAEDLCLFKVDYNPLTLYNNLYEPILESSITPLAPSLQPVIGTKVTALGNPNGQGIEKFEGEIASTPTQVDTQLGTMTLIKTTLAIVDGCSGGAVFDEEGRLYGLMGFSDDILGESFIIMSDFIFELYESINLID